MTLQKHHEVVIQERKWYGCRRDARDPRDHRFTPQGVGIPNAIDLRGDCPPVMDQGNLGSCTAHGITGALRYLLVQKGGPRDFHMSRLQLYYDERAIEGSIKEDAGAEIRDGIKCAASIGLAHESKWKYDIKKFATKPTPAIYRDAVKFKALSYERVNVDVMALKNALAERHPVVIGIALFESFESAEVERTGIVPMPNLNREQMIGGHCMYVVGYGQHEGYFTVRNSWNTDWGDKGDCYLPEGYIGSADYGADYWIVKAAGKPEGL